MQRARKVPAFKGDRDNPQAVSERSASRRHRHALMGGGGGTGGDIQVPAPA